MKSLTPSRPQTPGEVAEGDIEAGPTIEVLVEAEAQITTTHPHEAVPRGEGTTTQ